MMKAHCERGDDARVNRAAEKEVRIVFMGGYGPRVQITQSGHILPAISGHSHIVNAIGELMCGCKWDGQKLITGGQK